MAGERLAKHAVINLRTGDHPVLEIDGEPFPFHTDKQHGFKVEANDANVHLVIVAIQVDQSVSIIDHTPTD